eukprot:g6923.t1
MTSAGLPPDSHSDNNMDGIIPDKVGTAAIQERIEAIRRQIKTKGRVNSDSDSPGGVDVRWITSKGSRNRAAAAPRSTLPRAVWVLIFDQGSPQLSYPRCAEPRRGLYCLWSKGLNSAVAFQEREGALRYAFKLKARGLGAPGPTRVTMTDLQRFCDDKGFGVWVVPADVVPEAPQKTKNVLGFDPMAGASSRRLVKGGWGGLKQENAFSSSPSPPSEEKSILTSEDVRKWRADFERLYAEEE